VNPGGRRPDEADSGPPAAPTEAVFGHLRNLIKAGGLPGFLRSLAGYGELCLACRIDGREYVSTSAQATDSPLHARTEVGCIAKNLTSLLCAVAATDGRLTYDDSLARFFPECRGIGDSIKVFHLLNHTHGLDGSPLDSMPRTDDGYIDASRILRVVCDSPPISGAGELFYYYGNAGIWLAGAILERLYGERFPKLLRTSLPVSICMPDCTDATNACPATGGIALNCLELLSVAGIQLEASGNGALFGSIRELRAKASPRLPEWPRLGESAVPGWFCYGSSFGMFGQGEGTSSLIMISPEENVALALTGTGEDTVMKAQAALFSSRPRALAGRAPRPLARAARERLRADGYARFVGTYRKAALVLEVSCSPRGDWMALVSPGVHGRGRDAVTLLERSLLPAESDTFYPGMPEPTTLPFIQFRGSCGAGKFQYAMTGKHVFRRD
jgi:hypothetical protein